MKIIARGAEAVLYVDSLDGQKVLVKDRVRKNYRIRQIDEKLRKERTKKEVKLITDSRAIGVPTPQILDVDKVNHKIIMQFIGGIKIKDFLDKASNTEIEVACKQIGYSIGKLHKNDIIHGDLTTSNMILQRGTERIFFIDFGLGGYSRRIEDKGVDLKLLYDAIKAAHYKILKLCWGNILEGYKKEYKNAEEVIKKIEDIEGRTRYAKRNKETEGRK